MHYENRGAPETESFQYNYGLLLDESYILDGAVATVLTEQVKLKCYSIDEYKTSSSTLT